MLTLLELTYWQSVWQNAIGCAFGSGIAIIVSILIYWLTIRETEKSSRKAFEQFERNQLKAFALMIKDAINFTEKQFANTNEFIDYLKSHPNTFPLLHMQPLGTLKRIIDTITVEKTGITYMKYYPSENSAKEFIGILDTVDFLYAEYLALKEHLANASNNHTDRQYKISHYFDVADKLLWDYFASAAKEDTVANQIWLIKHKFLENRTSGSDIHYVNKYYFEALSAFTDTLMHDPSPFISNLHYNLQKGEEHYQYFKNGYDLFVEEMTGTQLDIAAALMRLKIEAAKILELNDA